MSMELLAWIRPALALACLAIVGLAHGEESAPKPEVAAKPQEAARFPLSPKPSVEPSAEEAKLVSEHLKGLGSEAFAERQKAAQALSALGAKAASALAKAAETSEDPEVRVVTAKLLSELRVEHWEGYYYSSLGRFEDAVKDGTPHVRFWLEVRRQDDGAFTARSDEQDKELGPAAITGQVDRESGRFSFDKQYDQRASHGWRYEGKWNPETGRIEGSYGPDIGGFVLWPRKLTEKEKQQFEQP